MSKKKKVRKVINWIWPPSSAKAVKEKKEKKEPIPKYYGPYDYEDWDYYGDGYSMGYKSDSKWFGKDYKYTPPPPRETYPVFMLEPTNRYRAMSMGKVIEEIVSDEMPIDTLDIEYHQIYVRQDNKEIETTLKDAPTGAMWFAPWLDTLYRPQLEHVLVIRLPYGTDFMPDAKAANCRNKLDWHSVKDPEKARSEGKKVVSAYEVAEQGAQDGADYKKVEKSFWEKWFVDETIEEDHHCWLIHGTLPKITINKKGRTCSAGGGSIDAGRFGEGNHWHGFLTNGVLI